jgi:hypothetical protein
VRSCKQRPADATAGVIGMHEQQEHLLRQDAQQ